MNEFELTMPEPPEPLPRGERFVDWQSLVGHTILAVIDEASGKRGCDVLIVTETHCWMALESEPGDCGGEAHVQVLGYGSIFAEKITDYASPKQLLRACVIGASECSRLETIRTEEDKQRNARRAQSLRAELARLEGGSS